jgi:hypothetical protein
MAVANVAPIARALWCSAAAQTSNLRLQLVPSSPLYGPQRSLGSITVGSATTSQPLLDAATPS